MGFMRISPSGIRRRIQCASQFHGQISIEMLITVGIIMAFTVPVLLLLLSISQLGYESSTLMQADATAKTLADNINELFVQGPGAKKTIAVAFPINMKSFSIQGKEVIIKLNTSNGIYEAVSPIFANASVPDPASLRGRAGLITVTMQTIRGPTGGVEVEVHG